MTTPGDEPRGAIVCNPTKVDVDRLQARVSRASFAAGWGAPLVFETTPDDLGAGATARALAEGAAAVWVAGGDGTVRAVAGAMARTGVPLAIVPVGTGNLLARNLRLPLSDIDACVQAVFGTARRHVDVGMAELQRTDGAVSEHPFVVMAGIGLDAAMIANTSSQLKKTMGWVAYVDGAAKSLPGAKPFRITYAIDDERLHASKVYSALFANCGTLPAGIELVPDASISDGMLDVALIEPRGWWGWPAVWQKVWWENSVLRRVRRRDRRTREGPVRYLRGHAAEAGSQDAQPVELDGDGFGLATRVRCRVDAGALVVAVPPGMSSRTASR